MLRAADHPASAADVVEATRLADALAVLRGRPLAGLSEVDDAARAVFGQGADTPMRLISNDLVVGNRLGSVPDITPMVPLAKSLNAEFKRCRLKPDGAKKVIELDLRQPLHLQRSQLLHRLALLDIPWGTRPRGAAAPAPSARPGSCAGSPSSSCASSSRRRSAPPWSPLHGGAACSRPAQRRVARRPHRAARTVPARPISTTPCPTCCASSTSAPPCRPTSARLMEAVPPLARTIRYGDVRGHRRPGGADA